MSYLAIARKWRPREFSDLVGQDHVVQTLRNAITQERVAHAYLFSGPRGIGKTSVARIFARALRCPNGEQPESDLIAEGRSLDVVEIDGASNNGVEAVREIRENVAYGASTGKYKIYIIDEVHMLSISAFNALLKTLEEPPPHVVFVFATTEIQKIPLTILSRCQRFEFRRLSSPQIMKRLEEILKSEGLAISEEGLRVIASHSDGALRDALSLLDQVLSYYSGQAGEPLSEAQVVRALGLTAPHSPRLWLKHVSEKNISGIFELIGQNHDAGIDLKHFAEQCLEEVRRLYLLVVSRDAGGGISAADLDVGSAHFAELEEISGKVNLLQTERIAQILTQAISQLSWASLPRFVLEMASVRMAHLGKLASVESALERGPEMGASAPAPAEPSNAREAEPVPPPSFAPAPPQAPVAEPEKSWKAFVDSLMKKRPLLGALLSHAGFKIEGETERKIHLAFPAGSFYEKQASEAKNKSEILACIQEYFGPKTELTLSDGVELTNASLEKVRQEETAALRKMALEHPSVLKAKETLGAEIVSVNIDN